MPACRCLASASKHAASTPAIAPPCCPGNGPFASALGIHESPSRWYPQGLKGEQILLGSRIIAVADVLEAMASHRPYRPALGIDAALTEIEKGRGTAFDPAVVDACLKLFREGRFAFQE